MLKRTSLLIFCLFIVISSFPCTIFFFVKDGKAYFCNNEDFSNPDTEIRFYPSKIGKYAWVYFGFSNNWAQGGVNEKGLCWDWVAGYEGTGWEKDNSKKTFKGNLSEKIITKCATVEEAIRFYKKYNEESFSYARIMLADKFGNSAIVGWDNGKFFVKRNQNRLQALGYKSDAVYSFFSDNQTEIDLRFFSNALDAAHQEGVYPTQYSNIISLDEGKIYLYKSHDFSKYVEINYLDMLEGKSSKFKIPDLFNQGQNKKNIKLKIASSEL